ncbi:hypothetical protein [Streptomyces sp. NPDC020747]
MSRLRRTGRSPVLEDLARNRVNLNKVITHWPDTGLGDQRNSH